MPELPEVETICRQLQHRIAGKTIKSVEVLYSKVVHGMSATEFVRALSIRKVREVGRQGKLILIRLEGDKTLVVHLKMTGRLLLGKQEIRSPSRRRPSLPISKSTEVIFTFSNGTILRYDDIRRFGYMKVVPTSEESKLVHKEQMGIDFFDRTLTVGKFKELIRSRGGSQIKPLLMDQSLIAGIGNVYAQEACFDARVHPLRKSNTLSDGELTGIYKALHTTMKRSIQYRGSSVDSYVDAFGRQGQFVPHLKVYGREGKPCLRCKINLVKKSIGGRGTVRCPKCQK